MIRRRYLNVWWVALAMFAVLSLSLVAQHTSAGVNGTVTDATVLVLPNTDVVLVNVDTNVTAHAKTNHSGYFAFVNVNPGQYTMTITKQGFKTVVLPPFQLLVDQTFIANQRMELGTVSETVTVDASAEGAMLQRSSSELGNVIEAKRFRTCRSTDATLHSS